jgi:Putative restriction endonuclease
MVFAPGASTSSVPARAPGRDERLPAVDDRLVAPEAHAEIVDGRVYRTMGANPPHATRHFEAAHVFAGVLAEGYAGAVDMLTRADEDSDAAPDVSIFPSAPDPKTGGRAIEEIAFEVLDTERLAHATDKVEKFAKRGVRRLFAVKVASRKVYEWDHAHHDWTELDADAEITDRCFRVPLPVAALLDRVLADDTVARALLASKNRVLETALHARETRGGLSARRLALRSVLAARGVTLAEGVAAHIEGCEDAATLDAWIARAATATAADDVFTR